MHSLAVERQELPFFADARHSEAAVLLLADVAGLEELLQERGCKVAILPLLLHLVVLLLQAVIFRQLALYLLLLKELGLLVGLNLLLGSAPLGACLQQVG